MPEIIFSRTQKAPLPFTTTYTPSVDSEIVLMLCGSAWTGKPHCKIGVILEIDGKDVCTAEIWSNGPNTHRLLMPGIVPYQFSIKHNADDYAVIEPVNITVKALNGDTNFDQNDYISLSIL